MFKFMVIYNVYDNIGFKFVMLFSCKFVSMYNCFYIVIIDMENWCIKSFGDVSIVW